MIICEMYEGDDMALAREQHDVYGIALSLIATGCQRHLSAACALLSQNPNEHQIDKENFDHRVMQDAHDILAAAWRHRARPPRRNFLKDGDLISATQKEWLHWLRTEITTWHSKPDLVRLVETILKHQNQDKGYDAEKWLCHALQQLFNEVAWRPVYGEPEQ